MDVFENFRNKCIEIYELDPANFLSASALAWQASLKETAVKLELLTDVNMLIMVEKEIKGGICHAIHRYAEANNKYMKNYNKNKDLSYFMYLHANNLHEWAISQKLPVDGFKWKKVHLNLIKSLLEIMKKTMIRDIFLKQMINMLKGFIIFIAIYHSWQEE